MAAADLKAIWRSGAMRWGLLAAVVLLLSLPLWGLKPYGGHFDHDTAGTWGDWVSGAGQVGAVTAAVGTVIRSENRERRRQRTAAAAWMTVLSDAGQPYWAVQVENSTALPVFRWRADSPDGSVHLCHEDLGPLVPGRSDYEVPLDVQADQSRALPLKFVFVDSDGRFWSRSELGGITAVPEPVSWHPAGP
ncbi:hypothetical protein AB0C90_05235 [Streptomyces sp. NPDC048550]|uniref:hypothetical protein n=1 Tax=unclassified Streptomyces TaxID=2593676 RepID=UPI0022518D78|nr:MULTISPECIES: hypothetical protein [unclassified Streptomyces]MCX5147460.1 hypothetical protein [Streptomyces sp. NBC_00320]WSN50581.1 hypothetical protein OG299_24320 [Streptomyces sp. NBC_01296]WSW59973.1 hypothetical protein OG513_16040 [Streptomyces sp. NBC_00998]